VPVLELVSSAGINGLHLGIQIECRICYLNLPALWSAYLFYVCEALAKGPHFDRITQIVRFTEKVPPAVVRAYLYGLAIQRRISTANELLN